MLQATLGVEGQGESIGADLCVRLLGGGLAGVTAASATYPLDLVRTRLTAQVNRWECSYCNVEWTYNSVRVVTPARCLLYCLNWHALNWYDYLSLANINL